MEGVKMLEASFNSSINSINPADQSLIEKAATTEQGVLISGEIGTGKEAIARIIHARSTRAQAPFVVMNCNMSSEVLESELAAKMETAQNGTIYLDEIQELPLHMQAKLVSSFHAVRIIASSSVNLQEWVADQLFRSDLYSKISYISFAAPALRSRLEQIPTLARAYIEKYNKLTGSNVSSTPSIDALDAMTSYSWPGNVRELEHVIERVVTTKGTGVIEATDLPAKISQAVQASAGIEGAVDFPKMFLPEKGLDLKNVVAAFENHLVDQALARTSGNKNRASQLLGLNRTTLVEKLRKRGMITPLKTTQAHEASFGQE